jgi:hypothetical protein
MEATVHHREDRNDPLNGFPHQGFSRSMQSLARQGSRVRARTNRLRASVQAVRTEPYSTELCGVEAFDPTEESTVETRSHRVHDAIGTVQVTAFGNFADGGGFAIAPPSLASWAVVIGGTNANPVDGAPATRFAAELSQILRRQVVLAGLAPIGVAAA